MKPITHEWVTKAEGDYAVEFRYPGENADRQMAKEAVRDMKAVLKLVKAILNDAIA